MNRQNPINHNLMQMIVSVIAFVVNVILLIYITKTDNILKSITEDFLKHLNIAKLTALL